MIESLIAAMLALAAPAQTPAGAERRCGWLANPTPGNFWLTDRQGEWTAGRAGRLSGAGYGRDAGHDDARLGRDQRPLWLWLRLHDGAYRPAQHAGHAALFGDAGAASAMPERSGAQTPVLSGAPSRQRRAISQITRGTIQFTQIAAVVLSCPSEG